MSSPLARRASGASHRLATLMLLSTLAATAACGASAGRTPAAPASTVPAEDALAEGTGESSEVAPLARQDGGDAPAPEVVQSVASDAVVSAELAFIDSATISGDGRLVAAIGDVGDGGEEVRVWRADDGAFVRALDLGAEQFDRVAFLDDTRLVVVTDQGDRMVEIVDADTGESWGGFGWGPQDADEDTATSIAVAPGREHVAIGFAGGRVDVYHVPVGADAMASERVQSWSAHHRATAALAWSPDGQWLASGGYDGVVRVWSAADTSQLAEMNRHQAIVTALTWSADGQTLYSGADGLSVFNDDAGFGGATRVVDGEALVAPADAMSTFVSWSPRSDVLQVASTLDGDGQAPVDEITALCTASVSQRVHAASYRNGRGGGSLDVVVFAEDGVARVGERQLEDRSGTFSSLVCAPGDRLLVSTLSEIAMVDAITGEVVWTHGF